jgi:isopentenyl-diphosphate delta-isomerase
MESKVILVDLLDNPIGEMPKMKAHTEPRLHRAFSVFLYHGNKMLIQQRAVEKYHSGGLWANACCSHPRPGEDLGKSAKNRLLDEAGIVNDNLEHLFAFTYLAQLQEDLYEYEYDHVFLSEYRGTFSPNPKEIRQMRWVDIPELLSDMLKYPLRYAPWFLICAPRVIETISSY